MLLMRISYCFCKQGAQGEADPTDEQWYCGYPQAHTLKELYFKCSSVFVTQSHTRKGLDIISHSLVRKRIHELSFEREQNVQCRMLSHANREELFYLNNSVFLRELPKTI